MDRLYQIIAKRFSPGEIAVLAADMGIFVPTNVDPASMARELFAGAQRNLRLGILFNEVHQRKAALNLDLRPNLYELIAGTFNQQEAAEIARTLGLDRVNGELDKAGFIGWNNDDFFKVTKARAIQRTAENEGKFEELLAEMKNIRPSLELSAFQAPAAGTSEEPEDGQFSGKRGSSAPTNPSVIHQYLGDVIYGDKVGGDKTGGDKVGGDKAGGNIFKDVTISDVSGSAVSLGGDAVLGTQVKDVQGNVNVGGGSDTPPDRETLLALMEKIGRDLAAVQSELRERDAREAAEYLRQIQEELQTEKPDGSWITRKLNNVIQIAGAVGVATAAANQLTPQLQQAVKLVQTLFGG